MTELTLAQLLSFVFQRIWSGKMDRIATFFGVGEKIPIAWKRGKTCIPAFQLQKLYDHIQAEYPQEKELLKSFEATLDVEIRDTAFQFRTIHKYGTLRKFMELAPRPDAIAESVS
jgi:hypothetical protein